MSSLEEKVSDSTKSELKNQPPVPVRATGYVGDVYDNMNRDGGESNLPQEQSDKTTASRAPTIPPRKVAVARTNITTHHPHHQTPNHQPQIIKKKTSDLFPPEPPPRQGGGKPDNLPPNPPPRQGGPSGVCHNSEEDGLNKPHPILSRMCQGASEDGSPTEAKRVEEIILNRAPKLPPRPAPVGRSTSRDNVISDKRHEENTKVPVIDPVAKEVKRVSIKSLKAMSRENSIKAQRTDQNSQLKTKKSLKRLNSYTTDKGSDNSLKGRESSIDELPDAPATPGAIGSGTRKSLKGRESSIDKLPDAPAAPGAIVKKTEELEENVINEKLAKCNIVEMREYTPGMKKKELSIDLQSISVTDSAATSRVNSIRSLQAAKRNRHQIDRKVSNIVPAKWYRTCKAVSTISFVVGFFGGGLICGIVVYLVKGGLIHSELKNMTTSVYEMTERRITTIGIGPMVTKNRADNRESIDIHEDMTRENMHEDMTTDDIKGDITIQRLHEDLTTENIKADSTTETLHEYLTTHHTKRDITMESLHDDITTDSGMNTRQKTTDVIYTTGNLRYFVSTKKVTSYSKVTIHNPITTVKYDEVNTKQQIFHPTVPDGP